MENTANSLLGATALGLSGYIIYKLLTTQVTNTEVDSYHPFVGYADDPAFAKEQPKKIPELEATQYKKTHETSNGAKAYEMNDNVYVYNQ